MRRASEFGIVALLAGAIAMTALIALAGCTSASPPSDADVKPAGVETPPVPLSQDIYTQPWGRVRMRYINRPWVDHAPATPLLKDEMFDAELTRSQEGTLGGTVHFIRSWAQGDRSSVVVYAVTPSRVETLVEFTEDNTGSYPSTGGYIPLYEALPRDTTMLRISSAITSGSADTSRTLWMETTVNSLPFSEVNPPNGGTF